MIILKPVPGLNYRVSNSSLTIIDNFAINYMIDTLDPQSPPSITVDSVHNYDRTHTLTVNIPSYSAYSSTGARPRFSITSNDTVTELFSNSLLPKTNI